VNALARCSALVLLAGLGISTAHAVTATIAPGELFRTHCGPCHGADGKARTPAGKKLGAKDLSASRLSDAEIQKQITTGTKNPNGTDRMPAFKDRLTSPEISALVDFVKTFRR
jgi:mono/diheme cytochrome c family protein